MKAHTPQPEQPSKDDQYTASDVKRTAGLSYRQLNNWESKGALPGGREAADGWRKFSVRDLFVLMLCSELRKQFHVPLESIKWIQAAMQQKGANHFNEALALMSLGFTVWLLTDCKKTFIMDFDLEYEDLFRSGYFRGDEPCGYIFLRMNPIVNTVLESLGDRMLQILGLPVQLKTDSSVYSTIDTVRQEQSLQSQQEYDVLKLIREGGYERLTVRLKNGKIMSAEAEEEIPTADRKRLLDIIAQKKYQTVIIKKHDGQIVRLRRTIPIKF